MRGTTPKADGAPQIQKIGEINIEIADAEERAKNSTDDVISSLASGGDVETLEKTVNMLRMELEAAELESAKWRHAIDLAEQAIESRRNAVDLAAHFVDIAARRVVGAEVNTAALLCAAEALRSELLDAQAKLAAIARAMVHGDEQRRTVDNFVDDVGWLIDSPWRDRPAARPIRDAFDKLRADASAALKV